MTVAGEPQWIVGVCSVLFDVDVGQKDSLSMELHAVNKIKDSTFFFRVRRRGTPNPGSLTPREDSHYAAHEMGCLYGYVFCRQRQDERLRRGAEQKSVVVLSEHPFSSVLGPLSQHLGPLFFNDGVGALQAVYDEISHWPPPAYEYRGVLAAGTLSLTVSLPPPATLPPPCLFDMLDDDGHVPGLRHVPGQTMLGVFHEADIYTPLRGVIQQLWRLWELMVLAEPMLVVGPTPGDCSTAVAALLSLITPLPYSADFRPYFTIHDPSFAPMAAGTMPAADNGLPRLLGITNLYFLKALPKWTNVLSVGAQPQRSASGTTLASAASVEGALHRVPSTSSTSSSSMGRSATGPLSLLTARIEALWSGYKPSTRPNSRVTAFLSEGSGLSSSNAPRRSHINSTLLRKHFSTLTTAFLAPFMPFVTPVAEGRLTPRGRDGTAAALATEAMAAQLPPFSRADFLATLKHFEFADVLRATFASTSSLLAFYKRFLESPNFSSWFERRRSSVLQWQQATWQRHRQEQLMSINDHMDEVQMIELFYSMEKVLEAKLAAHQEQGTAKAMPRDLQQTLLSAPHRASLLQNLHLDTSKVPGVARRMGSSAGV